MTTRILLLDDNEHDALLAVLALQRAGLVFEHELIASITELEAALDRGPWSAIVSDYNLGAANGLDALRTVRRRVGDVPFLLVSGTIGDERVAEAIREGANDYVSKEHLHRLPLALQRELAAAGARAKQRDLEESLTEIQERYRRTFEQAPLGIAHSDRDGYIITANAAYAQVFSCRPEELIGRRLFDFVDPINGGTMSLAEFQQFFDHSREAARYQRRYRRSDGQVRWANVTLSVMRDAHDRPDYAIKLIEDITEQMISREKLHIQGRLLECVESAVMATDLTGTVTYWNSVAGEMHGWSAEEAVGRNLIELTVPPHSASEAAAVLDRVLCGESWSGEMLLLRRDGRTFPALVVGSPMYDERGVLTGIVGIAHDLTEQKRVENRLRAHQLQLDAAQEIARVGSWTYDRITGEHEWSEGLCRLYGVPMPPNGSLDSIFDRVHPDDRARMIELQRQAHAGSEPLSTEFRVLRDGETRTMLTRIRYVLDDAGVPTKIIGVVQDITEEKRKEEELSRHAHQQSVVANLGQLALTGASNDFLLDQAAAAVQSVLGTDYGEILRKDEDFLLVAGKGWSEDELGRERIPLGASSQCELALVTGQPVVMNDVATETRFVLSDLLRRKGVASGIVVPIHSADGTTWGVLGAHACTPRTYAAHDIDFLQSLANMLGEVMARELARQELEESEHRYRRVSEGAKEIIFTVDAGGRFLALSNAFEMITGWKREEWLGRPFTELLIPEDRLRLTEIFGQMLETSEPAAAETTLRGKDRLVHVDVSSFPQTLDGALVEVYGFARDVTETRRATRERERATRNLELLLESTIDGIFTLDRDGRCTMVNRAAAAFLKYGQEEMLGASAHALLHPSTSERDCAILRVLATGESCSITNDSFMRRDGVPLPVAYSAAPIVDDGEHVGVVVTFTDLSERRKLEARLEQANRLSSLGRLAATVAHEFNNVLMGIAPFVEVVRRAPSPQKVATALDHIANSVKRGRRITQDILRFTQPAEPVRTHVEVQSWLQSVASEAGSLLAGPWQVHVDVEPLSVEGDVNQLHQIFVNLILNARDAMPGGGTITITARREQPDARFAFGAVHNAQKFAHFLVRDEGCGMSEETLRHAFEPLFTTKKNGTGLGLAVTHQVVQRHGGEIFIESALGEGTTFHVFLPLAEQPEQILMPEAAGEVPTERPARRILLVEDDESVAAGLISLLEFEGFEVALAKTGADALVRVRRNGFDAVLLDVGLPDLNGQHVYARIAAIDPTLPVIFSTGHADRGKLEDLLTKPNVGFLLKPYEAESLMEALARVMESRTLGTLNER